MMFLARASDRGLIPMHDLMNHHNGKINTRLVVDDNGGLSVIALYDISTNEPIYNTYSRGGFESSVDMFNTYGFIEDYPQLWRWNDDYLIKIDPVDLRYLEHVEPNSKFHEVIIISPTLIALAPSKQLVSSFGNWRVSLQEWEVLIIIILMCACPILIKFIILHCLCWIHYLLLLRRTRY